MRSKKQKLLLNKMFLRRGLFWLLLCLLLGARGSLMAQDAPAQETEAAPLPSSANPVDATLEKIRLYYGLEQYDKVMHECLKMDKLDPGNKMVIYYRTRAEEKLKEMGLLDKLQFTPEPTPTPLPARKKVLPPELPALSPTPAAGTVIIGTPGAPALGDGLPPQAATAAATPPSDNLYETGAAPAATPTAAPLAVIPETQSIDDAPATAAPVATTEEAAPTIAAPATTTAAPSPASPSEPVAPAALEPVSSGGGSALNKIVKTLVGLVAVIAVVLAVTTIMKKIRAQSKAKGAEQETPQAKAQPMAQTPRQETPVSAAPKPATPIQQEIPDFPDMEPAPQKPEVASIPSPSAPADELPPRSSRRMPPPDFAPPPSELPEIPEVPEIPDFPSPIAGVPDTQGLPPIPDLTDIPSPTQVPDFEPAPAKPAQPAPQQQTPPDLISLDSPATQPEADIFSFALTSETDDLKIPVDEAPEPEHPLESPFDAPVVSADPFAHLDVDLAPPPTVVPVPEGVPKEPPTLSIEEALGLAPPSAPAPEQESIPLSFDIASSKPSPSSTSMDLDSFLFSTPNEEQAETIIAPSAGEPALELFSDAADEKSTATGSFDSMMFGDETEQATQIAEPPAPPEPAPKPAPAPAAEHEEKPHDEERGLGQFSVESLKAVSPESEKKTPIPPRKKIEERNEALFANQLKKGTEAFEKGDWKKAVHYLSVAAAIRPDAEDLKNMLATARQNKRASEQS
ncbi:MAG: hypothetical protein BWY12_00264 [candidate division BRC1 bacterium ADurb.Bin183]|nr:MAG: hypothetical protein BWY12_00264 [candidate division BRC1 bacterium ADurb.Bin183]